MPPAPVRVAPGWLQPALAESFPWRCAEHLASGKNQCAKKCCGACYFLAPGAGCQLGSMRPVRCKTYPLIPLGGKVILHNKCPDARHFHDALVAKDPRALALLDVAIAMSDLVEQGGDDQSQEIQWMMEYVEGGYSGPTIWTRKRGIVPPRTKGPSPGAPLASPRARPATRAERRAAR